MYSAPQIEPITTMARNHTLVLEKLKNGPVFLTQRGSETAVIISSDEWRSLVKRLERLEQQERAMRADQRFAKMREGEYVEITRAELEQMDRALSSR
jgi:prevent-host-death family protein